MEIRIFLVCAEDDEAPAVGESATPLEVWSGVEVHGLDTVRIATLHSVLTGESLQESLDIYEPVHVTVREDDSEILVLRVADDLLERLACLDEEALEPVAEELAETGEFENDQIGVADVLELLAFFSEFAQLAESQGQVLFVRMDLKHVE
jgi:hypothetical protein